jgi:tetratricopeptide (TPR) repeat protein
MPYRFKHVLMRDAVYNMQLGAWLRELHYRAAQAIEELYAADLPPYYADLALHYVHARVTDKAIEYLHKAGDYAQEGYDVEQAISHYQAALELLPTGGEGVSERLTLYSKLAKLLRAQARYAEATQVLSTMDAEAEAIGDGAAQVQAWCELSLTQNSQGDNRAALASAERAEDMARAVGAEAELAQALNLKGWALYRIGNAEPALAAGQEAFAINTRLGAPRQVAATMNLLGTVYDVLGQYEPAIRYTQEALALYRNLGCVLEEGVMLNNLGATLGGRGEYGAALALLQEALEIARQVGDRNGEMLSLGNSGAMQIKLGNYDAAEQDLRQVIGMAESVGLKFPEPYSLLAQVCLKQGKLDEALATAQRALCLSQETREDLGGAWCTLGMVAAQLAKPLAVDGEWYDAAACFAESLRVYAEMGAEGERARTLWEWAKHELAQGDKDRGKAMRQEARQIFEHLGLRLEVQRMDQASVAIGHVEV